MTDEKEIEIERQAEKYRKENYDLHSDPLKALCEQSFIDGAKWGMEHAIEWHDLRKDSDDLPKDYREVLVIYSNTYDKNGLVVNKNALKYELAQYINLEDPLDERFFEDWFWAKTGTDDMINEVIAWCELPQFKE